MMALTVFRARRDIVADSQRRLESLHNKKKQTAIFLTLP